MADISKINAVALADIAKLDAVLAANIAKVNGLVFSTAPAFVGLLDETYGSGAAAAYSTRRLASATTVLLRVRRDTAGGTGDDDEADVAYDSNNILSLDSAISNASAGVTATTLGQFINVGTVGGTTYTNPDSLTVTASCLVDTWYDQAGSNDATQATHETQPQIHDGTVNTELITENGKPGVQADDTPQRLDLTSNASVGSGFIVYRRTQTKTFAALLGLNYQNQIDSGSGFGAAITAFDGTNQTSSATASDNTSQFLGSVHLGASSSVRINGSQDGTGSTGILSVGSIFQRTNLAGNSSFVFVGPIQEIVLYATKQSASNITAIEENINEEYLIYQPTDAPTSGLLADYTGAAAAYSVRQLSDKAVLSMRVRRDSDDVEQNFGFDSNGDLDTAGIASFCGTANGYVTRWWDQSTNGNHADQATDASQPQIYNGTAVITENGKPALSMDEDFLDMGAVITNQDIVLSVVCQYTNNPIIGNQGLWSAMDASNDGYEFRFDSATTIRFAINSSDATATTPLQTQFLLFSYYDGSNRGISIDGTLNTTTTTQTINVTSNTFIGKRNTTVGETFSGTIQEVILYDSDAQITNRTGIETDINDYYSIY